MHKVTIKTILLIAGLSACGIATAGGGGSTTSQSPMIVKTVVDSQEKVLIITGRNFGVTPPTVLLANYALEVKRFSENEVVASVPLGLKSGNYGVSVTTSDRNRATSNLFGATLQKAAMEAMRGRNVYKAEAALYVSQKM